MTALSGPFLRRGTDRDGRTYYRYRCPGCESQHVLGVDSGPRPQWAFDGNFDAPTFSPSVLGHRQKWIGDESGQQGHYVDVVCHSFVRAGKIEYLSDCTHELAGKTVPMVPWDSQ